MSVATADGRVDSDGASLAGVAVAAGVAVSDGRGGRLALARADAIADGVVEPELQAAIAAVTTTTAPMMAASRGTVRTVVMTTFLLDQGRGGVAATEIAAAMRSTGSSARALTSRTSDSSPAAMTENTTSSIGIRI